LDYPNGKTGSGFGLSKLDMRTGPVPDELGFDLVSQLKLSTWNFQVGRLGLDLD
jgi:hypothetical protein